ncbi:hypothetical protein DPV78_009866 [Talaromyces pinophilus]|nr:hypothetical protein DPV78_009866 [Talaromyces pinophilus]
MSKNKRNFIVFTTLLVGHHFAMASAWKMLQNKPNCTPGLDVSTFHKEVGMYEATSGRKHMSFSQRWRETFHPSSIWKDVDWLLDL